MANSWWDDIKDLFKTKKQKAAEENEKVNNALRRESQITGQLKALEDEYNKNNPNPLWLIHGVWVNDYVQNSSRDAYHKDFYNTFLNNCKTMVDVIHGNKKISLGRIASAGHGSYLKNISPWVIGYILGVEWEDIP